MTDESDGFAYYRDQLRGRVWSGFFNAADWQREARDIAYDPEAKRAPGMEIAGKRTDWGAETGTPAPRFPPPLAAPSKPGFFRRLFG